MVLTIDGGKRARGGGSDSGTARSKLGKLSGLRSSIGTTMLNVSVNPLSPIIAGAMQRMTNVIALMDQYPDTIITRAIDTLDLAVVTKLQEAITNNNNVFRMNATAKHLFKAELDQLSELKALASDAEQMIKDVTTLLMVSQHCGEQGDMSWSDLNKVLMAAVIRKAASGDNAPMTPANGLGM